MKSISPIIFFIPAQFFKNSIGISHPENTPREITLFFNSKQLNYIKTQPLHESQKIIEEMEGGAIIKLNVVINYELISLLLGLGSRIRVISPPELYEKIKEELNRALAIY